MSSLKGELRVGRVLLDFYNLIAGHKLFGLVLKEDRSISF